MFYKYSTKRKWINNTSYLIHVIKNESFIEKWFVNLLTNSTK